MLLYTELSRCHCERFGVLGIRSVGIMNRRYSAPLPAPARILRDELLSQRPAPRETERVDQTPRSAVDGLQAPMECLGSLNEEPVMACFLVEAS